MPNEQEVIMPFAKVNGINIHYQIEGKGEPLVIFGPFQ
jgi:hypothetical protein